MCVEGDKESECHTLVPIEYRFSFLLLEACYILMIITRFLKSKTNN